MPAATILVVDDEQLIRWSLTNRLADEGLSCARGGDRRRGAWHAAQRASTWCCSTTGCRTRDGLAVLKKIKERDPGHAGHPAHRPLERRDGGRGDEARRVPLRQQAVRPRRDRAARREGARDDAAAPRGADAARQPGAALQPRPHRRRESRRCRRVKALLQKIASSPASTVLLTGESGTGKDLAAKVHSLRSSRATRPFMNITCSALPETLLESELFGHERGAFTGADRQKRGLLEIGRRRHGVPRRDRRDGAGAAGEAAALSRGEDVQARRRLGRHARRRARDCRHQPQSARKKCGTASSARTCSTG